MNAALERTRDFDYLPKLNEDFTREDIPAKFGNWIVPRKKIATPQTTEDNETAVVEGHYAVLGLSDL